MQKKYRQLNLKMIEYQKLYKIWRKYKMEEFATLEKVKEFSLSNTSTNIKININYDDKIKQSWEFKK